MPRELAWANLICDLAEVWHCPPTRVLQEPAWVLQLLKIRRLGRPPEGGAQAPNPGPTPW